MNLATHPGVVAVSKNQILFVALAALGVTVATPSFAQFAEVMQAPLQNGSATFGVAWGDYDKDGDQDLYFTNGGGGPSKLLRNDAGIFVDVTSGVLGGVGGEFGAAWGDCDDDGDLDLYIANGVTYNELCRNDSGVLTPISPGDADDPGPSQSVAWADYDQDGDIDMYVTCWQAPNRLFRNEGSGTFTDVTPAGLDDAGRGTGAAWSDYDNDGDLDLYAASREGSKLWRNEGGGAFLDVTMGPLGNHGVIGIAWGDYDNDGDMDLYQCRDVLSNRLLRNDSAGGVTSFFDFYNLDLRDTGISQGAVWFDADNDMDLDLFATNAAGIGETGHENLFLRNTGANFSKVPTSDLVNMETNSRGVAAADFNQDGFVDLYVANWFGQNQLLRTLMTSNKWLHINLVGVESNHSAIGARVEVVAGGVTQIREVSGGSGVYSQSALTAYFGLGTNTTADVTITWPSGIVTNESTVSANQVVTLFESTVTTGIDDPVTRPDAARLMANMPNPFRSSTLIRYELSEPSAVELRIVDVRGRVVRTLERLPLQASGTYEATWNGADDSGRQLAGGIYFYSLRTDMEQKSRRMVLVR